ncbi:hypothetical protein C1645_737758 [Glomus cerebriforme]|uniref:Uncharacterized protein n=1 Tax=Glomus cerebriforme TaxID=658196 RepID=A0A397SXD1_9GLOM|nr:hypothetical protein C1645_737758 [Glomus cerebriforme]
MATVALGLPIFAENEEDDLEQFIELYKGYIHSLGIDLSAGGGPPAGWEKANGIFRACLTGSTAQWYDENILGKRVKLRNINAQIAQGNGGAFKALANNHGNCANTWLNQALVRANATAGMEILLFCSLGHEKLCVKNYLLFCSLFCSLTLCVYEALRHDKIYCSLILVVAVETAGAAIIATSGMAAPVIGGLVYGGGKLRYDMELIKDWISLLEVIKTAAKECIDGLTGGLFSLGTQTAGHLAAKKIAQNGRRMTDEAIALISPGKTTKIRKITYDIYGETKEAIESVAVAHHASHKCMEISYDNDCPPNLQNKI